MLDTVIQLTALLLWGLLLWKPLAYTAMMLWHYLAMGDFDRIDEYRHALVDYLGQLATLVLPSIFMLNRHDEKFDDVPASEYDREVL